MTWVVDRRVRPHHGHATLDRAPPTPSTHRRASGQRVVSGSLAMALPSSPPLLPVDDSTSSDLPAFPDLLPVASASCASGPMGSRSRKRQLELISDCSSDPLFSDSTDAGDSSQHGDAEDPDPDPDAQPRRKKKLVRGPWWHLRRRRETAQRLSMAPKDGGGGRYLDSGVWMGSDDSVDSLEGILANQQRMLELNVDDVAEEHVVHQDITKEALAPKAVQGCVDNGREVVDLSDMRLTALSDATLRPLHQLIKPAFLDLTHVPSEDEFGPLTPSIQLYLSNNQLTSLPAELFKLVNITVLSLRNNNLNTLPPTIARLQNLQELNVSGNRIRSLPWELLDVLHSPDKERKIHLHPNPLLEPCSLTGPSPLPKPDRMRAELELRLKLGRRLRNQYLQEMSRAGREIRISREELLYLASSSVTYFGVDGTHLRRKNALAAEERDFAATLEPYTGQPASNTASAAPSLFELALRGLQPHHQQVRSRLQEQEQDGQDNERLPVNLVEALARSESNYRGHGNESCATCGRHFIVARAEWMEYWFRGVPAQMELTLESVLPFLRRACSWECAKVTELGEFKT
ncbi:L domain-like protein [Teratosphaeria nubilosa]|uniref:L domain-like protein n=1 Tax=Teratosphaeria nubilosa TaxID=161662 RepID=A0A6G1L5E7_9PEZI|nr:L domain-like protein [Teratosphaeria nubilosa]